MKSYSIRDQNIVNILSEIFNYPWGIVQNKVAGSS